MNFNFLIISCSRDCANLSPLIRLVKYYAIPIIRVLIPVILILYGSIDFLKAIMASKEDAMKNSTSMFIKRIIYAVLVFFSFLIVSLVFSVAEKNGVDKSLSWLDCWNSVYMDNSDGCSLSEFSSGSSGYLSQTDSNFRKEDFESGIGHVSGSHDNTSITGNNNGSSNTTNGSNYWILHSGMSKIEYDNAALIYETAGKAGGHFAFECDVYLKGDTLYCLHNSDNFKLGSTTTVVKFISYCKDYNVKALFDKLSSKSIIEKLVSVLKENNAQDIAIFQVGNSSRASDVHNLLSSAEIWRLVMNTTDSLASFLDELKSNSKGSEFYTGVNVHSTQFYRMVDTSSFKNVQSRIKNICVFVWSKNIDCDSYKNRGAKFCMKNIV